MRLLPLAVAWPSTQPAPEVERHGCAPGRDPAALSASRRLLETWFGRPACATSVGGGGTRGASTITVRPTAIVSFVPRGRHPRITVRAGRAWITQTGERVDHLPDPGDVVVLAAGGQVVVQNLGDDALIIECEQLR